MCLLITGPASSIRSTLLGTQGLANDIYTSNSDGIGAMYTTAKGRLRTPKIVPRNFAEFRDFIRRLPQDDRPLALHARYKTHGGIDLENCHPYIVIPGKIAMMHNGVLAHGNKPDTTKSDTWHYIDGYIRPLLEVYPDVLTNAGWQATVESDIGTGNRFALMNSDGELVVLNKETGIEHDGMWFSNTYAWSPELLIPGYKATKSWHGGGHRSLGYYGAEWDWDTGYDRTTGSGGSAWKGTGQSSKSEASGVTASTADADLIARMEEELEQEQDYADAVGYEDAIYDALRDFDADAMADLLVEMPNFTLSTLLRDNIFVPSVEEDEIPAAGKPYVKMLVDEDKSALVKAVDFSDANAKEVAEVICWYGDWDGKPINYDDDKLLKAESQTTASNVIDMVTH